jgi:hypothetical protein
VAQDVVKLSIFGNSTNVVEYVGYGEDTFLFVVLLSIREET